MILIKIRQKMQITTYLGEIILKKILHFQTFVEP
jgi:hypothetical protein